MELLDSKTTVLVVIDLQKGIAQRTTAPHSADKVISQAKELAGRFRAASSTVILVNVGWRADRKDALQMPVDQPNAMPPGGVPPDFMELVDGLAQASDLKITKRQWGAFYGTEMDLQLRRRGIRTIVIAGIATNLGVESTARCGWEHGYAMVFAEDAMASFTTEMHEFAVKNIFPRIGRIVKTADIQLTI